MINKTTLVGAAQTKKAFNYLIDPALGGCPLIEDFRLFLDNQEISLNRRIGTDQVYIQIFNRVFATPEERETVGVEKTDWISTTQDIDETEEDDPAVGKAQDLVLCDNDTVPTTDAASLHVECALDGFFPLGPGRNFASCKLTGQKPNNKLFFPPFTKIRIELFLRKEALSFIHNRDLKMSDYFTLANNADELANDQSVTTKKTIGKGSLHIHKCFLTYETFKMDKNSLISGTMIYPLDLYTSQFYTITKGSSSYTCDFYLKQNVSHVYCAFLRDHQYDLNITCKKPLSAFTKFPTNMKKIRFELNGEILAFTDDLKDLDVQSSVSQKLWYEYLKNRKLITEPISKYFPAGATLPLHQLFFIDLTTHKIRERDNLRVIIHFKGDLSENSYKCFLVSSRPGSITRRAAAGGPQWLLNEA